MATEPLSQDSSFTSLSWALEETPGVLPTTPTWYPLEPNDYKDFGGEVKTKARNPINRSRQRKKGVVIDIDAMGTFGQDVTATNLQALLQTFLYAYLRTKDELSPTSAVASTDKYIVPAGGAAYLVGNLVFAKGFGEDDNNGLRLALAGSDATHVAVDGTTSLVDETVTGTAIISRVGHQFAASVASIDANGGVDGLPSLEVANVAASKTLTNDGTDVTAADTVTIGGVVYTFQSSAITAGSAGNVHVLRGVSNTATMTALFHAINNSGGVPGTDYDTTGTGANAYVTATNPSGTTVTVTSIVTGVSGNNIVIAESSSHLSWAGAATALSGGVGLDLTLLGLIPGEPVYIGSDETDTSFADDDDNGYCRVRNVTAGIMSFDKTEFQMADDAGTGKTIRIYYGRILKNENTAATIVKVPIQLERKLGGPDVDDPSLEQAEYITRCYGDVATLDMKTADIVGFDFKFMGGQQELADGTVVPIKSGNRPTLVESDAFNSTSDVSLIKLCVIEPGEAFPDPLFAYLTNLKVEIKNNLKQKKAVSVLGAFDVTPGMLDVSASLDAYFTKVASITAVRNNEDVTFECHMAKDNKGLSLDMPLCALGKARAEVKLNEPIMLPIEADFASGHQVDEDLDHTVLFTFWDYLPDVAHSGG